jgi:putative transcriptional regulator
MNSERIATINNFLAWKIPRHFGARSFNLFRSAKRGFMNFKTMSDKAILAELGERVNRQRLNRNITQTDLAGWAGVARIVVQRLEGGRGCTLENLIRILRALDFLDQLDTFLPEPGLSPLQLAKFKGRERLRAVGRRQKLTAKKG